MEEFFNALKEDFERARALWILNNIDLIKGYTEPQIFSGHTHTNRDVKANSTKFSYNCPVSEKTIVGNWGTGAGTTGNPSLKCMGDGAPFGFGCVGCARTNELSIFCLRKKDIPVLEVTYPDDEDGTRLMVNQIMDFLDSLPGGGGDLEGDSDVLGEPIGNKGGK